MNLKETYNTIAEDWAADHLKDTWWLEWIDQLISLLPKEATVLDVGCGAGHKAKYLADRGLAVTGIDFSEKMIEIARREAPNAKFQVLDLHEIDSLSEKFDCVFMQAVILHMPKKETLDILEKVKCILKDGGMLYIGVKEAQPGHSEEEILTEHDYGYEYQRFFSYFTLEELISYFDQIHLRVIDSTVTQSQQTRWIQIIGKK